MEQRSGDRLNFDQVALIMKFKADADDIYFLEAVPEQARSKTQVQKKIRLNRWGQLCNFIGSNKVYDLVAWRKVVLPKQIDQRKVQQTLMSDKFLTILNSHDKYFDMTYEQLRTKTYGLRSRHSNRPMAKQRSKSHY